MIGFRRLRFGFKGNLNETMLYKIEMDFATAADGSFKDAYLGWTELPFLQTLLVGQQKRPYGLDHLNSSRFNVFLERPYVIEGFNQDARRIGVCSYGTTEDERLELAFWLLRNGRLGRYGRAVHGQLSGGGRGTAGEYDLVRRGVRWPRLCSLGRFRFRRFPR